MYLEVGLFDHLGTMDQPGLWDPYKVGWGWNEEGISEVDGLSHHDLYRHKHISSLRKTEGRPSKDMYIGNNRKG